MMEPTKEDTMERKPYTRNRYVVRYWSRYRVNWVSVLVDAQDEAQVAEVLAPQGITEFEIIRDLGRSV